MEIRIQHLFIKHLLNIDEVGLIFIPLGKLFMYL